MLLLRASCSAVNASSGLILGYSAATSRVKSCKFLRGFVDAFLLKFCWR